MAKLRQLALTALLFTPVLWAQNDLPATFGPPPGSDPLTWGFYATPEIREPTQLQTEGNFPSWLTGSLYRGSAATWDVGNYTSEHWFDSFTRNHRFEIENGVVSYRSRNSSDELAEFVQETGLYPGGSFGADPCKVIFGAFETTFRNGIDPVGDKNTVAVDVSFANDFPGLNGSEPGSAVPFSNLVRTTDGGDLHQIDPVTLEPIELFNYQASHSLLTEGGRSAAHPARGADGSVYNYLLDLEGEQPVYRIFGILAPDGETKILANITDAPPAYIHSLFSTTNHLILVVWQADLTQAGTSILSSIGPWDPERNALFYVIDRINGGLVAKYEVPDTFFAFHEINSFEDEAGNIFLDLPRMNDTTFLSAARMPNLRANVGSSNGSSMNDLAGSFTRYRLPAKKPSCSGGDAGATLQAEIEFALPYATANIELPRINPTFQGKPYRYAYGIHVKKPGFFADSIIKIDTAKKEWLVWTPETNHMPSEPIFVAAPNATCEDDGVLLVVAMDSEARHSSLVVLDALTMTELGRARMPIVMGYGFHGSWGQGSTLGGGN